MNKMGKKMIALLMATTMMVNVLSPSLVNASDVNAVEFTSEPEAVTSDADVFTDTTDTTNGSDVNSESTVVDDTESTVLDETDELGSDSESTVADDTESTVSDVDDVTNNAQDNIVVEDTTPQTEDVVEEPKNVLTYDNSVQNNDDPWLNVCLTKEQDFPDGSHAFLEVLKGDILSGVVSSLKASLENQTVNTLLPVSISVLDSNNQLLENVGRVHVKLSMDDAKSLKDLKLYHEKVDKTWELLSYSVFDKTDIERSYIEFTTDNVGSFLFVSVEDASAEESSKETGTDINPDTNQDDSESDVEDVNNSTSEENSQTTEDEETISSDESPEESADESPEESAEKSPVFDASQTVDNVNIHVSAPEGVFPENCTLDVQTVSEKVESKIEESIDSNKNVAKSYTYDIRVLDENENEVQPNTEYGTVQVLFDMVEVQDENVDVAIYHVDDTYVATELDVVEVEGKDVVAVETDSFSYYTVEFTYDKKQYVLNGDESVALSDILTTVGLVGEVSNAVGSNDELFTVVNNGEDWLVTAVQAFDTEEWLKVTINDIDYTIIVTDDSTNGNPVLTFDSNGGTEAVPSVINDKLSGSVIGELPVTSRDGYTFDGWYEGEICRALKLTFNPSTKTESINYDWFYIFYKDENGNIKQSKKYGGTIGAISVIVPSNEFWIQFRSDSSGTYYGFKIDSIETVTDATNITWSDGTAYQSSYPVTECSGDVYPETGHNYSNYQTLAWHYTGSYIIDEGSTALTEDSLVPSNDTTYIAKWVANTYTITFDSQGGTECSDIQKTYGEELGELPTPTKDGYIFDGWFTDSEDGEQISSTTKVPLNGITYYAHWRMPVLTFNSNSGTEAMPSVINDKIGGTPIGELPTTTREGYTFDGWYANATKLTSESLVPNSDVTYIAKWTANTYTVSFDANGGSECSPIQKATSEELGELPISTREGYIFDGWFTESENGEQVSNTTKMPPNDVTYYAHWHIPVLRFNSNCDIPANPPVIDNKLVGSMIGDLPIISRTGYTFNGWYKGYTGLELKFSSNSRTYNSSSYSLSIYWKNSSGGYDCYRWYGSGSYGPANDIVRIPATEFWIYCNNYSSSYGYSFDYIKGTNCNVSEVTEGGGYSGNGYYTKFSTSSLSGTYTDISENPSTIGMRGTYQYHYKNESIIYDDILLTSESLVPNEDTLYIAKWTANIYTATFDAQGGSECGSIQKIFDEELGELPTPTKDGYIFDGWFTGIENGDQISSTTKMPASDITYYAHWHTPVLTFNSNGGTEAVPSVISNKLIGEVIGELPTTTREGYTFNGWYEEEVHPSLKLTFNSSTKTESTTYDWFYIFYKDSDGNMKQSQKYGGSVGAISVIVPSNEFWIQFRSDNSSTFYGFKIDSIETVTDDTNIAWYDGTSYQTSYPVTECSGDVYPETSHSYGNNQTLAWHYTSNYTANKEDAVALTTESLVPDKDTTYVAAWTVNTYTITFDSQGGTECGSVQKECDEELGELPTTVKDGYIFDGWFTESEGGSQINSTVKMPPNDVTYYAHWHTPVLRFDSNCDIPANPSVIDNKLAGSVIGNDLPVISRTGYTFDGWYKGYTGLELKFSDSSKTYSSSYPITLYWKNSSGEYDYYQWYGSGSYGPANDIVRIPATEFWIYCKNYNSSYGYSFDYIKGINCNIAEIIDGNGTTGSGYYTKSSTLSLSGTYTDVSENPSTIGKGGTYRYHYKNESIIYDDILLTSESLVPNEDTVYIAKWTINTFTITFDAKGGTECSSVERAYNETIGELPVSTRDGYIFDGWFTEESDGEIVTENTVVQNDITYFAHWTSLYHDIVFDSKGGTPVANVSKQAYEPIGDLPTPTKEGYDFLYWCDYEDSPKGLELKFSSGSRTDSSSDIFYIYYKDDSNKIHRLGSYYGTQLNNLTIRIPSHEFWMYLGEYYWGNSYSIDFDYIKPTTSQDVYSSVSTTNTTVSSFPSSTVLEKEGDDYPQKTHELYKRENTFWHYAGKGKIISSEDIMPLRDMLLEAVYGGLDNTISFESNGGSDVESIVRKTGEKYGVLPSTTKSGYTFYGWSLTEDGTTVVSNSDVVDYGDKTLYAIWEEDACAILYENGDLVFQRGDVEDPSKGTVRKKYTGFETTQYTRSSSVPWYNYRIYNIEFKDTIRPIYMDYWFCDNSYLKTVDFTNLDTSRVSSMKNTFHGNSSLCTLILGENSKLVKNNGISDIWRNDSTLEIVSYKDFECRQDLYPGTYKRATALRYSNGDLVFQYGSEEEEERGSVSSIYTDFLSGTSVPWSGSSSIKNVIFNDEMSPSSIKNWFRDCKNLYRFDSTNLNLENISSMSGMFNNCYGLMELNLTDSFRFIGTDSGLQGYWTKGSTGELYKSDELQSSYNDSMADTYTIKNIAVLYTDGNLIFQNSTDLDESKTVDKIYTGWDTVEGDVYPGWSGNSNITRVSFRDEVSVYTMYRWFSECYNLSEVDFNNLDTSSVSTMYGLFENCSSLENVNLSYLNTENCSNFDCMFRNCSELKSVNLSITVKSDATMRQMFDNCLVLNNLYLGDEFRFIYNNSSYSDSPNLTGSWVKDDTGDIYTEVELMTEYNGSTMSGSYSCSSRKVAVFNGSTGDLVFKYFEESDLSESNDVYPVSEYTAYDSSESVPWGYYNGSNIHNVRFDCAISPVSLKYWFHNIDLKTFDAENLDTSNTVDMSYAFSSAGENGDGYLKKLDLSGLDFSNVENMSYMFESSYFEEIVLPEANTVKLQDMSYMFNYNRYLKSVDLSGIDTSSVTTMYEMFYECNSLESINLSGWDTSSVTDFSCMFAYCNNLKSLDLSSFSTENGYTGSMLEGTDSLLELKLGENFKINSGTCLEGSWRRKSNSQIYSASELEELYDGSTMADTYQRAAAFLYPNGKMTFQYGIEGLTENTTVYAVPEDASSYYGVPWYEDKENIKSVEFSEEIVVESTSSWFYECTNLKKFDGTNLNLENAGSMNSMFYGCTNLTVVDFTNINNKNVSEVNDMFYDCNNLVCLKLGENFIFYDSSVNLPDKEWKRMSTGETISSSDLVSTYDGLTMADTYSTSTTITFNGNGATPSYESVEGFVGEVIDVELPTIERTGYTFLGWFSDIEGGVQLQKGGVLLTNEYFAHWEGNNVTLTFDPNDGTLLGDSTLIKKVGTLIGELPQATKDGYDFAGWKRDGDSSSNGIELKFSSSSRTEGTGSDFVYIYYKDSSDQLHKMGAYGGYNIANAIVKIPSDEFWIYFKSNSSVNYYGFSLDYVKEADVSSASSSVSVSDTVVSSLPLNYSIETGGTAYPETDHNYKNSEYKMWHYSSKVITEGSDVPCEDTTYKAQWRLSPFYALLYESGELVIQSSNAINPEKGDLFKEYVVEPKGYSYSSQVPWYSDRSKITTVSFEGYVSPYSTKYWFYDCKELANINFNSLNTALVTDMSYMFTGCIKLKEIDLTGLNMSSVINMSDMFYNCKNTENIKLSGIDTPALQNISSLFEDCYSLKTLDLSGLNTTLVGSNVRDCFYGCSKLNKVILGEKFVFSNNMGFPGNQWKKVDTQEILTKYTLVSTYDGSTMSGEYVRLDEYALLYDTGDLVFQMGDEIDTSKGSLVSEYEVYENKEYDYNNIPWQDEKSLIKNVCFKDEICPVSISYWFYNCPNLKNIDLEKLNTSRITTMYEMFYNCSSLSSVNLSGLNVENVTDMSDMFRNCSSLSSVNLSGLNTENVGDMSGMFYNCSSLSSVNLSGLNIENVTSMSHMFYNCSSLSSVNLIGLNTETVTDVHRMFSDCSSLSSVNLSGLNVTNMSDMFFNCSSLSSVNLSGLNTENVGNMSYMFYNCSSLSSLDLSGWNTANVSTMKFMFYGCNSLWSLDLSGWNTANVSTMEYMFYCCYDLKVITLGEDWKFVGSTDYLPIRDWKRQSTKEVVANLWNNYDGSTMADTYTKPLDVIFNPKNGERVVKKQNAFYDRFGEEVLVETPTRKGYAFAGWFDQAVGGTELQQGDVVLALKYYAQWIPNNYTLVLKSNGTLEEDITINMKYGEFYHLSSETFHKEGYILSSWNEKRNGSGITYQPNESVGNLRSSTGDEYVLYAQWTPESNYATVTFETDGGDDIKPITLLKGTALGKIPTSFKEGYSFINWHVGSTSGEVPSSSTIINEDTVLYAEFKKNPIVTFIGGIVEDQERIVNYNSKIGTLPNYYPYGDRLLSFLGWFTEESGGEQIDENTVVIKDVTYYAHWGWKPVFNANGGKLVDEINNTAQDSPLYQFVDESEKIIPDYATIYHVPDGNYYFSGSEYTYTSNNKGVSKSQASSTFVAFVPEGTQYEVSYRVSSEADYDKLTILLDGNTIVNEISGEKSGIFTIPSGKHVLFVRYTKDPRVDGGEDCAEITFPSEVIFGTQGLDKSLPTVVRDGYTFLGWFLEDGVTEVHDGDTVDLSLGTEIVAKWEPANTVHTITLNLNGGSCPLPTKITVYGEIVTGLCVPRKDGYRFLGWMSEDNKYYTNGDELTSDVSLTAQWKQNDVTVTFNPTASVGTGTMYSTTKKIPAGATIQTIPGAKLANYVLEGWYTEADGAGEKLTPDTIINENITYYAFYKPLLTTYSTNDFTYTFGAEWSNTSDQYVDNINGNLEWHYTGRGYNTLTSSLHLRFELNSSVNSAELPVGSVRIRVPKYIWRDWDGNKVGTDDLKVNLPQYPNKGSIYFSYTVDGDDYVLINNREISGGTGLDITLNYKVEPYKVPGGAMDYSDHQNRNYISGYDYYKGEVPVVVTIDTDYTEEDVYNSDMEDTVTLTNEMHTLVQSYSSMQSGSVYYVWNPLWGDKPSDAEDYFYVDWLLDPDVTYNGQPYEYVWNENTKHDGTVVGWCKESPSKLSETDTKVVVSPYGEVDTYVVLKYPKSLLSNIPESGLVLRNSAVVEITWKSGYKQEEYVSKTKTIYGGSSYPQGEFRKDFLFNHTITGGNEDLVYDSKKVGVQWELSYRGGNVNRPIIWDENTKTYSAPSRVIEFTDGKPGDLMYSSGTASSKYVWEPDTGNEILLDSDYYIDNITISLAEYDSECNDGVWSDQIVHKNGSDYNGVDVFVRYKYSDEWVYYKTVYPENYKEVIVRFPETVVGYKVQHKTEFYSSYFKVTEYSFIKPTSHIVSLVSSDMSADSTSIFKNKASCKIWESEDTTKNPYYTSTNYTEDNDIVSAHCELTKSKFYQYAQVTSKSVKFDAIKGVQDNEMMIAGWNYNTSSSIRRIPMTSGTFYNLLPAGTDVQESTIKGSYVWYNSSDVSNRVNSVLQKELYHVQFKRNWEGSNRTMMIIDWNTPEGVSTPGVVFTYMLRSTYANIIENGINLENDVAFVNTSKVKMVPYGRSGDQSTITEAEYFDTLQASYSDFISYSKDITRYLPVNAFSWGYDETVNTNGNYVKENSVTIPNNEYVYKLEFSQSDNAESTDIVFYDILEFGADRKIDGENQFIQSNWHGILKNVDVSMIADKDSNGSTTVKCNPVVYYSSKNRESFTSDDYDVSNTDTWSSTKPDDLSTVTAIAVDCRKATDGSDFVFKDKDALSLYITMVAPIDETAYGKVAYNTSVVYSRQGDADTTTSITSDSSVLLRDINPEIHKVSNYKTGTLESPTEVFVDTSLDYTLTLKNTDQDVLVKDIVLEDIIPDGLKIDYNKIKFSLSEDDEGVLISDSPRASVSRNNQKLTFTVHSLDPGETAYIIIPTVVNVDSGLFVNTAKITSVNGVEKDIDSETTYHEAKSEPESGTKVTISKVNRDNDLIGNSVLRITGRNIYDSKDIEPIEWTTVAGESFEVYLNPGDYVLHEVSAPEGYVINPSDVKFTVGTKELNIKMFNSEGTTFEINNTWNDGEDSNIRPDTLDFKLYQDGVYLKTVTVTKDDDYHVVLDDLQKYSSAENHSECVYTVKEVSDDYSPEYTYSEDNNSVVVRNTLLTTKKGKKIWNDDTDIYRPNSITVRLLQDGVEYKTQEVTNQSDWEYAFSGVPKYSPDGVEYVYSVKESYVEGYFVSYAQPDVKGLSITIDYQTYYIFYDWVYVYYIKDGVLYRTNSYGGSTMNRVTIDIPASEFWLEFSSSDYDCSYYGVKVADVQTLNQEPSIVGSPVQAFPSGYTEIEVSDFNEIETLPHGNYGNNIKKRWHYVASDASNLNITNTKLTTDYTKVQINKLDNNGNNVINAHLQLLNDEGVVIKDWVTENSPEIFDGLASGTYTLHEVSAPEGYKIARDITIEIQETTDLQTFTMVDKLDVGIDMTISNSVSGSGGNKVRDFNFELTLEGSDLPDELDYVKSIWSVSGLLSSSTGTIQLTNGKGAFTLSDGEKVEIQNIPCGLTYSVRCPEAIDKGYMVTATNVSGTTDNDVEVVFNLSKDIAVPTDSTTNNRIIWLFIVVSGMGLCIFGTKKRKKYPKK